MNMEEKEIKNEIDMEVDPSLMDKDAEINPVAETGGKTLDDAPAVVKTGIIIDFRDTDEEQPLTTKVIKIDTSNADNPNMNGGLKVKTNFDIPSANLSTGGNEIDMECNVGEDEDDCITPAENTPDEEKNPSPSFYNEEHVKPSGVTFGKKGGIYLDFGDDDEDVKLSESNTIKHLYTYEGPIYRFNKVYKPKTYLETMAVSTAQAVNNLIFKAAKEIGYDRSAGAQVSINIDLINKEEEETGGKEVNRCEKCGTPLTDGGFCPKCDDGVEDLEEGAGDVKPTY